MNRGDAVHALLPQFTGVLCNLQLPDKDVYCVVVIGAYCRAAHRQNSASFDRDETRTRNLLIRSQTPYPLGHAAGRKRNLYAVLRKVTSIPLFGSLTLFPV